jgi:hypothetical protein
MLIEIPSRPMQESPESLLRSALQGKGYAKTVHLQNGITVIPAQNSVKDEELRRALFTNDQVRDSTLYIFLHFAYKSLAGYLNSAMMPRGPELSMLLRMLKTRLVS